MDEMIAKAKQGDQASIERLVADYTGLIRAIANKVYVVGGDKDDLLQEGMLGLFFAITNYDETKGAFPSYAKLCVKGRIADAVRKYVNDKNKPLADYIDIASIEQMTDESTPLTDLIVKEQAEKIESVMRDKLTKGEFDVMSLFVSGYRYDDICRMTGRSYKSVDGALQRARKKLAEALKND